MLTENNKIFRNWFVIIHHLTKVSVQIVLCIIFERNELSITTLWLHQDPLIVLASTTRRAEKELVWRNRVVVKSRMVDIFYTVYNTFFWYLRQI